MPRTSQVAAQSSGLAVVSEEQVGATLAAGSTYYETNSSGAVVAAYVGDENDTPVQVLAASDLPALDLSQNNLLAANGDPMLATQSWTITQAWLTMALVTLTKDATITKVVQYLKTVGSGFSNFNGYGLFLPDGTRIATSADQAAVWGGTTGEKEAVLTADAGQTLARQRGEKLIVGILVNATASPAFSRLTNTGDGVANIGCDGSTSKPWRFASAGSTSTTLQASLPTRAATTATPWVGLR